MVEGSLILLGLGVLLSGPIALVMVLVQQGKIGALTRQIALLETRIEDLRRQSAAPAQPAGEKPAPATTLHKSSAVITPVAPAPWRATPEPVVKTGGKDTGKPTLFDMPEMDGAAGDSVASLVAAASQTATPPQPPEAAPTLSVSSTHSPREAKTDTAISKATALAAEQPIRAAGTPRSDWEARIGKRWLTWGGVLLLVASAGFLVKYAYEQGWIGPWTQVGLGITVGCALCCLGDWQIRKRDMRPLGQGVMALGLTLVYITSFGAFAYFKLEAVSQITALVLLALTSAAGVALANRHRALAICVLSALGGYLAPVLVSTGKPPPVSGLFTYTLLVNVGIIAVATLRSWPALPLLAFGGTMAHFWGWHYKFYEPGQAALVATWAAIFHFVFLFLPALPLIKGARTTPWQWLLPLFNAVTAVWAVWTHLHDPHPLALLLLLVGMAAGHVWIGMRNFRKTDTVRQDDPVRGIYIGLGLAILTLAPLAWFGIQSSLVCWLVLGLLLIDLGFRLNFRMFRIFGYVNLLVGIGWCLFKLRTVQSDLYMREVLFLGLGTVKRHLIADLYGNIEAFLNSLFHLKIFWTRLAGPAALGTAVWLLHRWREKSPDRNLIAKIVCGVTAGFLAAVFISLDVNPWLWLTSPEVGGYARSCALAPLWCLGAAATVYCGHRWRIRSLEWLSLLFLVPAAWLAIHDLYIYPDRNPEMYFLNFGYAAGMVFAVATMFVCRVLGGGMRILMLGLAGYILVVTQQVEIQKIFWNAELICDRYSYCCILWIVAATIYTVLATRRKTSMLAHCFWLPVVVASGFLLVAWYHRGDLEIMPEAFKNLAYAAGLMLAAAFFARARLLAGADGIWVAIVGGWLVLAVNHVELDYLLWHATDASVINGEYRRFGTLSLLWTAGAVVFGELARRIKRWHLAIGTALPLIIGAAITVYLLVMRPGLDPLPTPFFNTVFLDGLLIAAAMFLSIPSTGKQREWWGIFAGLALLATFHVETNDYYSYWLRRIEVSARYAWFVTIWAVGACGYLAAAIRWKSNRVYYAGVVILMISGALFAVGYHEPYPVPYTIFLNMRFAASAVMVAGFAAFSHAASRYPAVNSERGFVKIEYKLRTALYVLTAALGLALVTLECHFWCLDRFGDVEDGRRVARMSVSIAWAVYSITLLGIGFSTRIRGWRLAGLALFAATCIKLLASDLRHLELLHRIPAFMAIGLLLMAASYLYHKLEKRMGEGDPPEDTYK